MNPNEIAKKAQDKIHEIVALALKENRATTEAEDSQIENLQKEFDEQTKMSELIAQGVKNALVLQANVPPAPPVDNAAGKVPGANNVTITGNPPQWKNGIGSILNAVRNSTISKKWDERFTNSAKGNNSSIPDEGGVLVGTEEASPIIEKIFADSTLASQCETGLVGEGNDRYSEPYLKENSRKDGYRDGGLLAYWGKEAGTMTYSSSEFGKIDMELEKLYTLFGATNEQLQDSAQLASFYKRKVPKALAFKVDDAIISGSGAGVPLGVLNSNCLIKVAKESGQTNNTVVPQNFQKMFVRLKAEYRANSAFYINQEIELQMMQMTWPIGTGGVSIYMPPGGLSAKPYSTLLGLPVIPIEQCSALGDVGDVILGNFKQYLIIKKAKDAIQEASSIHVEFLTDQQVFRTTFRVNGQPLWQAPLTPYKGSSTLSTFTTIAAR